MNSNTNKEVQDNSYNSPEFNNWGYMDHPYLACPYLRQYPEYPEYPNPIMYPNDEYPVYDDMFRQRHRRRRPFHHHPFFDQGGFPWWWFFFL